MHYTSAIHLEIFFISSLAEKCHQCISHCGDYVEKSTVMCSSGIYWLFYWHTQFIVWAVKGLAIIIVTVFEMSEPVQAIFLANHKFVYSSTKLSPMDGVFLGLTL